MDTAAWPFFISSSSISPFVRHGGITQEGLNLGRIYLFFGSVKQLKLILHPEGMYVVRMDKQVIDQKLEMQIMAFMILYILTFSLTALLLTAMDIYGTTAFSVSIATLGNVGPGFGGVSSMGNYNHLPDAAKYILSANMLLGRLEIMNVFALFMMISLKRKR